MRIKKETVLTVGTVVTIALAILLPDRLFDLLPSENARRVVAEILVGILILFLMVRMYRHARKKEFTTTKYIVLADCVQIAALAVASVPCFSPQSAAGIDGLLFWSRMQAGSMLVLLCVMALQNYWKSQKFRRT